MRVNKLEEQWQENLSDLLNGYFGCQSLEVGVKEMIFVTKWHQDYHQRYISAIEAGIAAADRGDIQVIAIIRHSWARFVDNTEESKQFLEELSSEYNIQYDIAIRSIPIKPPI